MIKLLYVACILTPELVAQGPKLQFDSETFVQQFANGTAGAERVAEYIRLTETVANWTKMVAIRNFPNLTNPKRAAADLARSVRQHNPRARHQILAKNDGSESQIDFLTWTPRTGTYAEFNIHRYRMVEGYPGLISYQFAYRFSMDDAKAVEVFKANRERWIRAMTSAEFDTPFRR